MIKKSVLFSLALGLMATPVYPVTPGQVIRRCAQIAEWTAIGAVGGCLAGAGVGSAAGFFLMGKRGAQAGFDMVNQSSNAAGIIAGLLFGAGLGAAGGSAFGLWRGAKIGTVAGAVVGFVHGIFS